jgi:hypothetical protein
MIRVGFVKDASQCPPNHHRVAMGPGREGGLQFTVNSWPDGDGSQQYELLVDAPTGAPDRWIRDMARCIKDLGWRAWWLESGTLARVLARPLTDALTDWGLAFWPHCHQETVALLALDGQRSDVYQAVRAWERNLPFVRFANTLDFDTRAKEQAAARPAGRRERLRGLFRPRFQTRQKA